MIKKHDSNKARLRRHRRVRKKVSGSASRPRLAVFRSATNIYAQVIDDTRNHTLLAASTLDPEFATAAAAVAPIPADDDVPPAIKGLTQNARVKQAWQVGHIIAQRALAQGINQVVFDRGGYIYHGRVAALAEGARQGGLRF